MKVGVCEDCDIACGDFPDVVISDTAWDAIMGGPRGILCPNCMHKRLKARGYGSSAVPGTIMSGPMCCPPTNTPQREYWFGIAKAFQLENEKLRERLGERGP